MKRNTRTIALLGLCTAFALILAYIEAILPPIFSGIPGIKLGLPNIIIIFLLYRKNAYAAIAVSLVRIALVALLFGNAMSLIYSLCGGVLSIVVMILLRKLKLFSAVGVSVAGAVFHNIGQILAAMVLLETTELAYYLAVLLISGTLAGIFIGLCGAALIRKVPKSAF